MREVRVTPLTSWNKSNLLQLFENKFPDLFVYFECSPCFSTLKFPFFVN